jgi:site-specific recombinase XerD
MLPSTSAALTIAAPGVSLVIPSLIAAAGEAAQRQTLEFFTARLPNAHTREAYGRAVARFCAWCDGHGVELTAISAPLVAAYVQGLGHELGIASVKQHLAALRHWMDWLTERGVLSVNPAAAVRGPRHVVQEGKTPVLERDQARRLLEVLDGTGLRTLRDRALIAVMLFGFVRVGAVVKMRVRDFDDAGGDAWLVLEEKGGKQRRLPAHHLVRDALRAYVAAAALEPRSKAPLFQSAPRTALGLSGKALSRHDVLAVVKRRCAGAGLPANICNHSFRATGITIHQENGGRIEDAAELAGHASTRTTQLYNRKLRKIARAEVERVQL